MTYNPIDVYKITKERALSLFNNRMQPINLLDEIINYSGNFEAASQFRTHLSKDEIAEICLFPEKCTIEQICLIGGIYEIHIEDLFFICAEHMALQLYSTKKESIKIRYLKDLFKLKEKRLLVSRLSKGFYQDLQNMAQRRLQVRQKNRREGDEGFSVRI